MEWISIALLLYLTYMERRLFVQSYLKEAYNLGANTLAEKSKEGIQAKEDKGASFHFFEGLKESRNIIDSTLKRTTKMKIEFAFISITYATIRTIRQIMERLYNNICSPNYYYNTINKKAFKKRAKAKGNKK